MELTEPTVSMLGTVAGLGLVVTIVVEIILRAANPSGAQKDRFGPLLALVVGLVLAGIGSAAGATAEGFNIAQVILLAIVTAGVGMGIHDTVTSQTGTA